jgi:hypothetical protein
MPYRLPALGGAGAKRSGCRATLDSADLLEDLGDVACAFSTAMMLKGSLAGSYTTK